MRGLFALVVALLLCACSAAAPGPTAPEVGVDAPVQAPPQVDPSPIKTTQATEVDYSCRVDSDCAVKDVGNCCGYYPACVNRDSPTFPEQVRADCERDGVAGICGFPDIQGCQCVESRCQAAPDASVVLSLD